ncbi:MAG: phosphopantothenoylcysteine decarboxylase [Pirellulales bacterium]|nr:phosphopantothenoylcysteine decarboxylase [Pirellulales bacterium]
MSSMPHEILIGVTGGIAAYKTAAVVSRLVQNGHGVSVVITRHARQFVGPVTFEALTGRPVFCELFSHSQPLGPHIDLAQRADVCCIAPATANILGKAASGIADDLVSTLILAFTGPLLFAPAMHCHMWNKPAVQRNLATLTKDGYQIIQPEEGWLSCRHRGMGRMASPERIVAAIEETFNGPR